MMHTSQALYDELRATLIEIDVQISQLRIEHREKQNQRTPLDQQISPGTTIYQMRTRDGAPVLEALLVARAATLNGMAVLKAAASSAGPGRGKW